MGNCGEYNQLSCRSTKNNNKSLNNVGNCDSYKFEWHEKKILTKKTLNLQFIFSQIRIKHCISRNPSRISTYIIELSIGRKNFNLIINKGKEPIIPPEMLFEVNKEFTLKELEETYFSINIYEYIEEINTNLNQICILPPELKSKCKYNSYFNMDLLSFLFKSKKCDFLMMGNNQLSSNTRISFICNINHKEIIKITVKKCNNPNISKLIFQTKNTCINDSKSSLNSKFSINTPPMTMKELQQSNLFLESNENEIPYTYITLNNLKYAIIKNLGETIIKEENDYIQFSLKKQNENKNLNTQNNTNNANNLTDNFAFFGFNNKNNSEKYTKGTEENQNVSLTLENLPFITQISSLYFTEYGHLYNTSFLNIINNDVDINNYRKNAKISSDDFYIKLKEIYINLTKGNFEFNKKFEELNDVLRRSVDTEKFYFLYPNLDSLIKMINVLMNLRIKIIEFIQKVNDEIKLNILLKSITYLMRREELENDVLNHCLSKVQETEINLKNIYNKFFINILKLNDFCKIKKLSNTNSLLIDLYSKLYFKKKYIREAIFNTIFNKEMNYDEHQIDLYIYDISIDGKLNRYLDQNEINQIIKKEGYFSNLFLNGTLFFRNIIAILKNININEYPFDFIQFNDNQNILNLLRNYVKNKKIENLGNEFFEITLFLSDSYESINKINDNIIKYTNGYNNTATFKLFDHLKTLLQFYYTKEQCKLIMDYSVFEQAINSLIKIDNSITLPKLYSFYYNCSHLIISEHLKYFIMNICNKNFNNMAFHWSFTCRQIFFKLVLFIFNNRIKDEEGKLFRRDNLNTFEKGSINKKINYGEESLKDYNLIHKEFLEWKGNNPSENKEYPAITLITPNGLDSFNYLVL